MITPQQFTNPGTGWDDVSVQRCINESADPIFLPPGNYTFHNPVIINRDGVRISGSGSLSPISYMPTTGHCFEIGWQAEIIRNILFRDLVLFSNNGGPTGAFKVSRTRYIDFENIIIGEGATFGQAFYIGDPTQKDDVINFMARNITMVGKEGLPAIALNSGSIITFDKLFYSGTITNPGYVFLQDNNENNIDGLHITNFTAENPYCFLRVTGEGISNFTISNGISDTNVFSAVYMAPSGVVQYGTISDVRFQGDPNYDGRGIYTLDNGGAIRSVTVNNCVLRNFQNSAIETQFGNSCQITNNVFLDCGLNGSSPMTSFYRGENLNVSINTFRSVAGPTAGIFWDGGQTPGRMAYGNNFLLSCPEEINSP